jgi:ankyrin repeat protein
MARTSGADPRISNREGHTALNAAALLGHREIYGALAGPRD